MRLYVVLPERIKSGPLNVRPVLHAISILLLMALMFPQYALAECREYKIIESEEGVEAVCVGELLTEAEQKAIQEEEKRLEAEAQRQRDAQMRLLKDNFEAKKAEAAAEAEQ